MLELLLLQQIVGLSKVHVESYVVQFYLHHLQHTASLIILGLHKQNLVQVGLRLLHFTDMFEALGTPKKNLNLQSIVDLERLCFILEVLDETEGLS